MTYTFKLARRLAMSRDLSMVSALLLLAACAGDTTGPETTTTTNQPASDFAVRLIPRTVTIETNQKIRFRGEVLRGRERTTTLALECHRRHHQRQRHVLRDHGGHLQGRRPRPRPQQGRHVDRHRRPPLDGRRRAGGLPRFSRTPRRGDAHVRRGGTAVRWDHDACGRDVDRHRRCHRCRRRVHGRWDGGQVPDRGHQDILDLGGYRGRAHQPPRSPDPHLGDAHTDAPPRCPPAGRSSSPHLAGTARATASRSR